MALQVFALDQSGNPFLNTWAGSWQGWSNSWQGANATAALPTGVALQSAITALVTARDSATGFSARDAFACGSDGQVYTAWWRVIQGWQGWLPVATAAPSSLRNGVSAIVSSIDRATGFGNLDLFAAGDDGNIYTAWFRPAQSWQGWAIVPGTPSGIRLQGAQAIVSSVDRATGFGNLDVFAVGEDGRVYTNWWRPSQGWHDWRVVATAPAGGVRLLPGIVALTTSLDTSGFGNLDVFALGDDGRVYTAWFRLSQGWQGWRPVANVPASALRSGLSAVVSSADRSTGFGNLDVFAVDADGRVQTAWWRPSQGWQGWRPVAQPPAASVSITGALRVVVSNRPEWGVESVAGGAVTRGALHDLDVFAQGSDGQLYTAWWRPAQGWQGWLPVSTLPAGVTFAPSAPAVYATPVLRMRWHLKTLPFTPNPSAVPTSTMSANLRALLSTVNIEAELASTEALALPGLIDVPVGSCTTGPFTPPTASQNSLFANRNFATSTELVLYYVRSVLGSTGSFNGCATYPSGQPGAVIDQTVDPWTLAHEVGHVLGLPHCDSPGTRLLRRLMTGNGTATITNLPPDLIASEIATMDNSPFTSTF